MDKNNFNKVVIVGPGLIGGSIAKFLKAKKISKEIVGVFRRESTLKKAIDNDIITKGYIDNYVEAVKGANLIIITTPVNTIKQVLEKLSKVIKENNVLVTDVGSTKGKIVEYANKFNDVFSFVGVHPLAGSDKTGLENATCDLFKGALCLLTPDEKTCSNSLNIVKVLWELLGANVEVISPIEHDKILAVTSHFPHIVSYLLVGILKEKYIKYVSTGFKDTTRIAGSSSELWADIVMDNKENILNVMSDFEDIFSDIKEIIKSEDIDVLKKKLSLYKNVRDKI